jgi:hypothetical protein
MSFSFWVAVLLFSRRVDMMKNQKIGERHSDLECRKCGMELKWVGGIMDGKMTCPNNFCMDKPFGGSQVDAVWIDDFSANVEKAFHQPTNAVLVRYYCEVVKAHRAWCMHLIGSAYACDCGHALPCPYTSHSIEIVEVTNYGAIHP